MRRTTLIPFVLVIALIGVSSSLLLTTRHYFAPIDITLLYTFDFLAVHLVVVGMIMLFALFALRPPKSFERAEPKIRFVCLVPAYNEAGVIQNSVVSLLEQNYPKDMFEVVVVFNGTDTTAQVAEGFGAQVICTPKPGIGKHKALLYAIEGLVQENDERYFCIFDADNVASRDYLQSMNNAIVAGDYQCLQGWHDVLNPQANWITKALWVSYTASSRLYNLGRYNSLGNALICGTGWCCKAPILKLLLPNIKTQVEDIELNGLLLLYNDIRVPWVTDAIFYDEKPGDLWVAVRQRQRWMTGHMRLCWYLFWPCLKAGIQRRNLALIEIAFYYTVPFGMSVSVLQFLVVILGITLGTFTIQGPLAEPLVQLIFLALTLSYIFAYQVVGFGLHTGKWRKGMLYSIYSCLFSMTVWTLALAWAWRSLFRSDWIFHTPHIANVHTSQPIREPATDLTLSPIAEARSINPQPAEMAMRANLKEGS